MFIGFDYIGPCGVFMRFFELLSYTIVIWKNIFENSYHPIISDNSKWHLQKNTAGAFIPPRWITSYHIHPSPAGCRDKIDGAKSRCKALGEGYYRLNQPASYRMQSAYVYFTYIYMLNFLNFTTIYIYIYICNIYIKYTQFVHHSLKMLNLWHVYSFLHC